MPMPASEIETLIKAAFPDAEVVIEDLRGDGDHYACRVVSTAFAGKSRVQQAVARTRIWRRNREREVNAVEKRRVDRIGQVGGA